MRHVLGADFLGGAEVLVEDGGQQARDRDSHRLRSVRCAVGTAHFLMSIIILMIRVGKTDVDGASRGVTKRCIDARDEVFRGLDFSRMEPIPARRY